MAGNVVIRFVRCLHETPRGFENFVMILGLVGIIGLGDGC